MGMVMMPKKGVPRDGAMGGSLRCQGRQRAMQIRSSERLPLPEHLLLLVGLVIPLGIERPVFSGHLLLRLPCPYATPPFLFP